MRLEGDLDLLEKGEIRRTAGRLNGPPQAEGETVNDLRYPIGQFKVTGPTTDDQVREAVSQIAEAPSLFKAAVEGLSAEQLDTPYRPGGWTVRQVVHHVPDSHLNSYCRFKLALTEEQPTIKAYYEDRWAELEDSRITPIEVSLAMLESLHRRWVTLLESLGPSDFARTFQHPDIGVVTLAQNACLYAWHGRHHAAQITSLRERMGWDK
jgi:hypothetical protein